MKHMCITDMTIRQAGKAAGYTLSFREKIELAKLLDRLGVSAIELHAVENPKIDSLLIKSVASAVKTSAVSTPSASEEKMQIRKLCRVMLSVMTLLSNCDHSIKIFLYKPGLIAAAVF